MDAGHPHFEASHGNLAQNRAYCSKESTDLNPFQEFGTPAGESQGKRTDLDRLVEDIKDNGLNMAQIAEQHATSFIKYSGGIQKLIAMRTKKRHHVTELHWYHGPTGTGKSRLAWEQHPDAYSKDPHTKWWDGYAGENVIIIDDYRPSKELPFNQLLRLADRYPLNVECKGGWINFAPTLIVITTPKDPIATFESLDWIGPEALDQLQRRITLVKDFSAHSALASGFNPI